MQYFCRVIITVILSVFIFGISGCETKYSRYPGKERITRFLSHEERLCMNAATYKSGYIPGEEFYGNVNQKLFFNKVYRDCLDVLDNNKNKVLP